MHRKEFLSKGCKLCSGLVLGSAALTLLNGCATGKVLNKDISLENQITINKSEFEDKNFVIVRNKNLSHDIFLYKKTETEYFALLMQCTHYDNPVFANNKELFCPSHGSKFNYEGKVLVEPATKDLKQYKTTINNQIITIVL